MPDFIERTIEDLRFAVRAWRRAPGVAAAAIATLALGIGATTGVFTVVSGVLLRPLPFADPGRVVQLSVSSPADPRLPPTYATIDDLQAWRRDARSLERVSTYSPFSQNLQQISVPEQVATVRVDRPFFETLGATAAIGRAFGERDSANVVVASFGFWQRRLAGDRSAVGRTIVLDGQPFTVIGVMPAEFEFPYRTTRTDLWTLWTPPRAPNIRLDAVIGRLRPGVRIEDARGELTLLSSRLSPGRRANVTALAEVVGGPVRESLLVLLGAVNLVLLVGCANVANLLLARAAGRRREVAVRRALGAGSGRLVRQFLTESLLLAAVGAAAGLAVAVWTTRSLLRLAGNQLPRAWEIGLDWRVLLYMTAVCASTALAFGLAPAVKAARTDVQRDLKAGDRGGTARGRLRDGLVVAEIALAFILLTGAGLLLRTFFNLRGAPVGFAAADVLTLHVAVADAAEASAIESRTRRVPGVRDAGFISFLPLQSSGWYGRISIAGVPGEGSAEFRYVTPGYFAAMGIPIRQGRLLSDRDTAASPKVLLVNEAFVRQYLPGRDPVGRELTNRGTIVGVVGDVRQSRIDRPAVPEIYYPLAQNFAQLRSVGSSLVVRSSAPRESLVPSIRQALREINPNQAAFRVATMEEVVEESMGRQTLYAWLLTVFAAIGTALASAGVYGVMSYVVTLRTRELAVRIALGASPGRMIRTILFRGAFLAAAGLAIGLVSAIPLTQLLEGLLFGVSPRDPVTLTAIAALLMAVALVACAIPARRAATVEPVAALKAE